MSLEMEGQPIEIVQPPIAPVDQVMELTRIPTTRRVAANQLVNNDVTLVDVTDLLFPGHAGESWAFTLFIAHNSSGVADMDVGWSLPGTSTALWGSTGAPGALLGESSQARIAGLGADGFEIFQGVIVFDTDGDAQLQFGQGTAEVSNTTILAESYMVATRLL